MFKINLLYLDIQRVPQGLHKKADSLLPHWVEVLMDGLTPEYLFPCNLKLHIWVTGPWGERHHTHRIMQHITYLTIYGVNC